MNTSLKNVNVKYNRIPYTSIPRFKNPLEIYRNLQKKYGNKTISYLEYFFKGKSSNLFIHVYKTNFTRNIITNIINNYNSDIYFNDLLDQRNCFIFSSTKNNIKCIQSKAIYFKLLFYYFSIKNNKTYTNKAHNEFKKYYIKFLNKKNFDNNINYLISFLNIIFKDIYKISYQEFLSYMKKKKKFDKFFKESKYNEFIKKKYVHNILNLNFNHSKYKESIITFLNTSIICKIKEIINNSYKSNNKFYNELSNKISKDLKSIPITNQNKLADIILSINDLSENQKNNFLKKIFIQENINTSKSNWIQKYMKDNNYNIIEVKSNGDCLFDSIRKAYESININYSIFNLRKHVSKNIDQDKFNLYKTIAESERSEYKNIKNIKTLNNFKRYILTPNFWGDENVIKILENILNMKLIVFSEHIYRKYKNLTVNNDIDILTCTYKNINRNYNPQYYIMVTYSGNHYRLITYNNKSIFTFNEIPETVKILIVNNCMKSNNGSFSHIQNFKNFKNNLRS